jgi:putative ABC transport system permease protein
MWFTTFLLKNLRRRPLRSILTITAVALGVGAVVSLVGIATGFKASFLELYGQVGIDLLVIKGRVGRQLESGIPESMCDRIRAIDGVEEVIPGLNDVISFPNEDLYMVVVNGLVPESKVFEHFNVIESGSLVMPTSELQPLMGRESQVLGISVMASDETTAEELKIIRSKIESLESGIVARRASMSTA